jgi:hypothetical protein
MASRVLPVAAQAEFSKSFMQLFAVVRFFDGGLGHVNLRTRVQAFKSLIGQQLDCSKTAPACANCISALYNNEGFPL